MRRDAAARLYVEYRERIYRFCLSRLRNREEAEDAVQNVFLRVHMALDRGVVPEYEAAWLYKIAHNVCLSRIDSNARHSAEELHAFDDDDVQIAAPEVSREELAGLNEALEAMPHNLRTALLLREWQGLSYAEIAVAMDLSVSAVETLIFRGRRHLANALEQGTPTPRKKVVARLGDLLGLGWLRSLLFGAGGAAKLTAAAALLALGGGGAAVALTTDAHARPAPLRPAVPAAFVASTPALVPLTGVLAPNGSVVPRATGSGHLNRVPGMFGVEHRTIHGGSVTPIVAPPAPATTQPAAAGVTPPDQQPAPSSPAPSVTAGAQGSTPTVSVPTVSTPVPTANVPSTSAPAVSVPAVSVPTASVPTVSVPAISVPTVSVPVTLP